MDLVATPQLVIPEVPQRKSPQSLRSDVFHQCHTTCADRLPFGDSAGAMVDTLYTSRNKVAKLFPYTY